jgi:hypothetical protein
MTNTSMSPEHHALSRTFAVEHCPTQHIATAVATTPLTDTLFCPCKAQVCLCMFRMPSGLESAGLYCKLVAGTAPEVAELMRSQHHSSSPPISLLLPVQVRCSPEPLLSISGFLPLASVLPGHLMWSAAGSPAALETLTRRSDAQLRHEALGRGRLVVVAVCCGR